MAKEENKIIIPCTFKEIDSKEIKWGLDKIQGPIFEDKFDLVRRMKLLQSAKNYQDEIKSSTSATYTNIEYEEPTERLSNFQGGYYDDNITKDSSVDTIHNSKEAENWNKKGNTLFELERFEEAMECYDTSIKLNPEYANPWCNKGNVLFQLGRRDEAIKAVEESIKLNPEYAEAWFIKGKILESVNPERAIRDIDKSIGLKPDNAEAWFIKAVLLSHFNRTNEAIKAVEESIKLNPNLTDTVKGPVKTTQLPVHKKYNMQTNLLIHLKKKKGLFGRIGFFK